MNKMQVLTSALYNLVEELRLAGYNIGISQFIAVQDLILALAAQDQLPSDLTQLRTLLGPILCHSPREQEHFKSYFERWLNQFEMSTPVVEAAPTTSPLIDEPELQEITKEDQIWKWIFIVTLIVFIATAFYYWSRITEKSVSQPVATEQVIPETTTKKPEQPPVETTPSVPPKTTENDKVQPSAEPSDPTKSPAQTGIPAGTDNQ